MKGKHHAEHNTNRSLTEQITSQHQAIPIPVYGWGWAPTHLLTRRQLNALGLSPAQPIVAELRWRKGQRYAYLYDRTKSRTKKPATPRQLIALAKAMTARRTCPVCRMEQDHVIPTSLGCCVPCWNRTNYGRHHPIGQAA